MSEVVSTLMPFDIVVVADADRGIARDGKLPWHLPGDLAHFKQVTSAARSPALRNVVIMGRKTWDSIPARYRPLEGRINIVVSRQQLDLPAGVLGAGSIEEALRRAADLSIADAAFVVGGGQLYAEAVRLPACRRIYYTRVDGRFDCDTFFPPFEEEYRLETVLDERVEKGIAYRIEVWGRRDGSEGDSGGGG
jgi:dihydrofolate reductase